MKDYILACVVVIRTFCVSALLSFNGAFVDTAGFLGLHGLFTAHVTGNFVMWAQNGDLAQTQLMFFGRKGSEVRSTSNGARVVGRFVGDTEPKRFGGTSA